MQRLKKTHEIDWSWNVTVHQFDKAINKVAIKTEIQSPGH
jgi:hypothetical protein